MEQSKSSVSHLSRSSVYTSDMSDELLETEGADLDAYLAGVKKVGRTSRKKIDWSKAFEDDSLRDTGDVTKSELTNRRTLSKPIDSMVENKRRAKPLAVLARVPGRSPFNPSTPSRRPLDLPPSSDKDASRDSDSAQSAVRQKLHFIDSDDGGDNPVRANVHSIDALLSVRGEEDTSNDTSDVDLESADHITLLHTVDELNPIEDEIAEDSATDERSQRSFGVVMTIDQLEIADNVGSISIISETAEMQSPDESTGSSKQVNKSDLISSKLSCSISLSRHIDPKERSEDAGDAREDKFDYSESFDSDSQGLSLSVPEEGDSLVLCGSNLNAQVAMDETSRSDSVHDLNSQDLNREDVSQQLTRNLSDQAAYSECRSPSNSCKSTSEQEMSSRVENSTVEKSTSLCSLRHVEAAVQTDTSTVQMPLPHLSGPQLVGQTSVDPVVLNSLCSYTPAALALHEMMKEQLEITQSFVASYRRLAAAWREDCQPVYRYTTLEDTQQYIRQHRPRIRTMAEAMEEVNQTD